MDVQSFSLKAERGHGGWVGKVFWVGNPTLWPQAGGHPSWLGLGDTMATQKGQSREE